jgi:methionyl-tRNA synthetase
MSLPRYTVTAALPYANGPLHLGHVAGVYLPADIFVRFLRLKGHDVAFICGSDEHGAAITLRAKKEGVSPQEIVDKYHQVLADSFKKFNINFDIFHRTSAKIHQETAQEFFLKLNAEGKFIKQQSEQFYDEEFNQFLADRYITGECPHCNNPNAYGDQCEKCGTSLSPSDLIHPKSTLSGQSPVLRDTSHWYLPMERHEDWLKPWIKQGKLDGEQHHNPATWRNQVVGQCMSWIDGGLKPRAMTRDLDWGVPVPIADADGKVLYVWLDAPIGYISATKQWAKDNGKNWEDYWKSEGVNEPSKLVHFIGKDNIVFHAIIFPIILKEFGGLILPDNVPASEFLNLEGDKFSTSRNWAVWLHEYLESYPEKIDELKYTLTAIAPESKDSEFTWDEYQARVNNELVAILGNFVNRALVLTNKYYDGIVPKAGAFTEEDKEVLTAITSFPVKIEQLLYAYKIREAQSEMMNLARLGNKYLADHEPWKLQKTDSQRVETIMYVALQITGALSILMEPFLANSAAKIRDFVGLKACSWGALQNEEIVPPGTILPPPSILFQKIDDELVKAEQDKLFATKAKQIMESQSDLVPEKSEITFDDFVSMDIRVGEILTAEKVAKADKLLQLTVHVGLDTRTIVSGIAEHYTPEEVVGQQVLVLVNLAPRKIRGVESKGMILMAENPDGKLCFVAPVDKLKIGSVVR